MIARLPGVLDGGGICDALTAPVDLMPSLCSLCGVGVPRSVEGCDVSQAWLGQAGAVEQQAVLTMNFTAVYDHLVNGEEWRGVRTKTYNYARWLNGTVELHDLVADPLQQCNLAGQEAHRSLQEWMEAQLAELMAARNDELVPCETYGQWFDAQRRVVRNAHGPLGDPEDLPDWSLLS